MTKTAKTPAQLRSGEKVGSTGRAIPLSENERKFHAKWTADDCIAELTRIAKANPDQVISRNYFRVNSNISESTWNRYFGTFHEFKRQAGIVLSRHAHGLERHIAKHASTDIVRALNEEKRNFSGKWQKPAHRRFKTVLACSDIHDIDCDPFYRRILIETAKRAQPDIVALTGDIFDLPEFGKYTNDPRDFDVVRRIKWVHTFLRDLRNAVPDAEIQFIEGNHEFRLLRHLSEATPALKTVLSDLHGFTISKLLGLDQFEINYIAPADLRAWSAQDVSKEVSQNYSIIEGCAVAHHFPQGKNMGLPGWNGHHHKHNVWTAYSPTHGAFEWHQLGAGHIRKAPYCNGKFWTNGFALVHMDTLTKRVAFEYIDTTGDHAVVGGTWYTRRETELVA